MNMFAMMVEKAFKDADKDNSGSIDRVELKEVLGKLAKDLKLTEVTDDDVTAYLKKLDLDNFSLFSFPTSFDINTFENKVIKFSKLFL